MAGFRNKTQKVPHHISIFQVGVWISFLGVNEIREFDWISDEENWSIVSNHIIISFFSVKFNSKTSWISFSISTSFFTSDSTESGEEWCSFANLIQEFSFTPFLTISKAFKIAKCSTSFSINNSFWNSFSVELCQFVNQMEILEKYWSIFSSKNGVLIVIYW